MENKAPKSFSIGRVLKIVFIIIVIFIIGVFVVLKLAFSSPDAFRNIDRTPQEQAQDMHTQTQNQLP